MNDKDEMLEKEADNDIKEATSEGETKSEKKKLRGYALVRVVMMCVFAALFAVFATVYVMYLVRNHKSNLSNDKVMEGFNGIVNEGTVPDNDSPLIIIPSVSTDPSEDEKNDEAYMKYVAECLAEARRMAIEYPDFRAIIVIEGDTVNLKYPILQTVDNQYYVNHLIDGSKNSTGEIFLDYRNGSRIIDNRNSVIYGHNMNDGTKFGQLHKYKKNNAFYTHNITIVTTEAVYTFKPFSFYKTDIYNQYTKIHFDGEAEFAEFCRSEQKKSLFESNIEFIGKERIITLSTCYGTSDTERYCLHAVLVNIAK